jgi:hypothetical protein
VLVQRQLNIQSEKSMQRRDQSVHQVDPTAVRPSDELAVRSAGARGARVAILEFYLVF